MSCSPWGRRVRHDGATELNWKQMKCPGDPPLTLAHFYPLICILPGFPVHHHLPELAQTNIHWVGDANQPSHPLLSPSPPVFNISQHQGLSNELAPCIKWQKYWSFSISPSNEYSGLISFRIDWLDLLAVQGLSRVFSNTTVQKHQFIVLNKMVLFKLQSAHKLSWNLVTM